MAREDLGRAGPGGGEGLNLAEAEGEFASHPEPWGTLLAVEGLEILLPLSSNPESSKNDGSLCVPSFAAESRGFPLVLVISGSPFISPTNNKRVNSHYGNSLCRLSTMTFCGRACGRSFCVKMADGKS